MTALDPLLIRIPNLPQGKLVDEQGNPTDDELTFRQRLITSLQDNFGNEGVVAPSQSTADITTIQNHQLPNGAYTCQGGTLIYDLTTNELKVAILVAGVPTFRVVQVI